MCIYIYTIYHYYLSYSYGCQSYLNGLTQALWLLLHGSYLVKIHLTVTANICLSSVLKVIITVYGSFKYFQFKAKKCFHSSLPWHLCYQNISSETAFLNYFSQCSVICLLKALPFKWTVGIITLVKCIFLGNKWA